MHGGPLSYRHYTARRGAFCRHRGALAGRLYSLAMLFLLAAVLVAVDQLTKAWSKQTFAPGESMPLALGFNFTYVENTGAAFGLFRGVSFELFGYQVDGVVLLGLLSALVSLALVIYMLGRGRQLPLLGRLALAFILAGAVGNLIDRFAHRYVIDFIHFQVGWFDFPVFNVADICVVVGAIMLFIWGFLPEGKPQKEPAPNPSRFD